MDKYTLLDARVNGEVKNLGWGELEQKEIPVEITNVRFVRFEPTKGHLAYYMLISNKKAGFPKDELICDVLLYYNKLPFKLKEGDLIRAYMHHKYITIADRIEKI